MLRWPFRGGTPRSWDECRSWQRSRERLDCRWASQTARLEDHNAEHTVKEWRLRTFNGEATADHGHRRDGDGLQRGSEDQQDAVDAEAANYATHRLAAGHGSHDNPKTLRSVESRSRKNRGLQILLQELRLIPLRIPVLVLPLIQVFVLILVLEL